MKNKELKTLKDFDWLLWRDKGAVKSREDKLIHIQELKAEAIKEIKLNFPTEEMPDELRGLTQEGKNAIKDYIKWKNNLTESDLKEVNNLKHMKGGLRNDNILCLCKN